jgi:hypothetical protein
MNKIVQLQISQFISFLMIFTGLAIVANWRFNFNFSHTPTAVTSAVCFCLSGVMLWLIALNLKSKWVQIILSGVCQWILLLVVLSAGSSIYGLSLKIENLFVPPSDGIIQAGTLFGLFLIGLTGLIFIFNSDKKFRRLQFVGFIIFLLGLVFAVSWVFALPFKNFMSLNSALMFLLYGIGLRFAVLNDFSAYKNSVK